MGTKGGKVGRGRVEGGRRERRKGKGMGERSWGTREGGREGSREGVREKDGNEVQVSRE